MSDPFLSELVAQLERLTGNDTTVWLRDALQGRKQLPLIAPDEPRYLGVLRIIPALSKQTRTDLEQACSRLMRAVLAEGASSDDYLGSLLRLVVHFRQTELTPALEQMASNGCLGLTNEGKTQVLGAIVDLGVPQTADFWNQIFQQSPLAYGALALSGLLLGRWQTAVDLLAKLPNDQAVANSVTIVLEQHAIQLPNPERTEFLRTVKTALNSIPAALIQNTIRNWLIETGSLEDPFTDIRKALSRNQPSQASLRGMSARTGRASPPLNAIPPLSN